MAQVSRDTWKLRVEPDIEKSHPTARPLSKHKLTAHHWGRNLKFVVNMQQQNKNPN